MGAYTYGDPSRRSISPRPPCWGTSKFDNDDRECRNCGFHNSCREQTVKAKTAAQTNLPASNYFSQFQPVAPYAAPQVVQHMPAVQMPQAPAATTVVPIQPAVPVAQAAPQQPQPQPQMPVIQDRYGQFQDPMFVYLKATPSVMRPQLPGESFQQRVVKNMALASVESALSEVILGVRQFLWAPSHDKEKK